MKFKELLKIAGNLPCFTARFLSAGENLVQIRVQLARWVRDGRVVKLHKGFYTLAEPYRKIKPELFSIANALKPPSYVSLQSALSWHGLIPEFVPAVTSITTGRPQIIETPLGRFEYRHINTDLFWGYQKMELNDKQEAFTADAEKAILDLVHLTAGGDKREFLEELRLQNLSKLRKDVLGRYAEKSDSAKLKRAAANIERILEKGEGSEL
jgi:predicted transcriptional regulator of viral defense system